MHVPIVKCSGEILLQRLLHGCSRHLSGLSRFELRLSTIAVKTGGCPRTVPPIKEVAEESQTHTHTHTAHGVLGRRTQERIVTGRNEQEPQTNVCSNPSAESSHPIKSGQQSKAQLSGSAPVFRFCPTTCPIQRSSPEGSLVHPLDVS